MTGDIRFDTFIAGVFVGIAMSAGVVGLYQTLVTKGYTIAVELVEAGWTARELRAHKKAAVVLPWMQRMREEAGAPRWGSGR